LICEDSRGRQPFTEWLESLTLAARAVIEIRIDRIEDGNFGGVKPVGGGMKKTQAADIADAKRFWSRHD
jgi:putative component of toxin-antitoxin plasmid stabilization module